MSKSYPDDVIEFLQQSNYIEREPTGEALDDAVKAWEYLSHKKHLTKENLLHTHRILMKSRTTIEDRYKGAFRDGPVFIGGREAKKYYAISMLMDNFLATVERTIQARKAIDTLREEECSDNIKADHIMFEDIHPFFDGNGRMGRIILNWERVKCGLPILVIKEEEKFEYYKWFENLK